MSKYVCTVCGFVYDEEAGIPDKGIAPGTKWQDLPENWVCPLCGAAKAEFKMQQDDKARIGGHSLHGVTIQEDGEKMETLQELAFGEISTLCSNLEKGCEKQYLAEEAALFHELAEYYKSRNKTDVEYAVSDLLGAVSRDLSGNYPEALAAAAVKYDRGALRALVWGEKATRILSSLLKRYESEKNEFLENAQVYVCDICGFVYIGDEAPEICPVCKVPRIKINPLQRR